MAGEEREGVARPVVLGGRRSVGRLEALTRSLGDTETASRRGFASRSGFRLRGRRQSSLTAHSATLGGWTRVSGFESLAKLTLLLFFLFSVLLPLPRRLGVVPQVSSPREISVTMIASSSKSALAPLLAEERESMLEYEAGLDVEPAWKRVRAGGARAALVGEPQIESERDVVAEAERGKRGRGRGFVARMVLLRDAVVEVGRAVSCSEVAFTVADAGAVLACSSSDTSSCEAGAEATEEVDEVKDMVR